MGIAPLCGFDDTVRHTSLESGPVRYASEGLGVIIRIVSPLGNFSRTATIPNIGNQRGSNTYGSYTNTSVR
jgi:hypothetical protein